MCLIFFLARAECELCLSVGLAKFCFMANILRAELCEEKIDYP